MKLVFLLGLCVLSFCVSSLMLSAGYGLLPVYTTCILIGAIGGGVSAVLGFK